MVLKRLWHELALIGIVGCGVPPGKPARPNDRDAALLVHAWEIADHVLATTTTMTESDARALHGRIVNIGVTGYTSPWHGTCADAVRQKRDRILADVTTELDVPPKGRGRAAKFGLTPDLIEFTLSCTDEHPAPAITLFIANNHAMTCFGGVCYLLKR